MKKEVIESDRETIIDKTQEQETVSAKPVKKTNYVLWAVIAIIIVLIIVSVMVYINMQNKKKNEHN